MIIISYNIKMTSANLLVIVSTVLVLLLLYYYYSKKMGKPIPDKIPTLPVKPVKSVKLPKRSLEIVIDSTDSESKNVQLSTVNELEKVIDDIVAVNMADRKAINEEATRLEQRIIEDKKVKVQELKTGAENVITEKKKELSAFQKRLAEMKERQRLKKLEREKELQKQRSTAYAINREKNRIENEKKLAELRLKRRQAADAQRKMNIKGEVDRMNVEFENERLLSEARDKMAQDKIKAEAEAAEIKNKVSQLATQAAMDEEQARIDLENAIAKEKNLKTEYENIQRKEQEKIDAAMAELEDMLEAEKTRQMSAEEDDEKYRAKEKERLLAANAAAIAELQEAEAEQARMDAEEQALRDKVEADVKAQEQQQQNETDASQSEYDAQVAADQANLERTQRQSEETGDSAQEAERQRARETERTSQQNYSNMSESERQRELEQQQRWDRMSADTGEEWMYNQARANRNLAPGEEDTFGLIRGPNETAEQFRRRVHMTRTGHKCYDNQTDTILDWEKCEERERKQRERERLMSMSPNERLQEDCLSKDPMPDYCFNRPSENTLALFESGEILDDFAFFLNERPQQDHLMEGSPGGAWNPNMDH